MSEFALVGHELETPLINAAGSINGTNPELILKEVELLAKTAIGAITIGSFTVPRQEGNEAKFGGPTYFHNNATGATYNSMGLPNVGLEVAKEVVSEAAAIAHSYNKPLIASVSPTVPSEEIGDTFQQVEELVRVMKQTKADLIEINTSCPNVVTEGGGRKPILGYDIEGMHSLVASLKWWPRKLGVKLPPYTSREQRHTALELAPLLASGTFSFIVSANTIPNQIPRNENGDAILSVPGGAGGMSGPITREVGRNQLRLWERLLGDRLDIVSTLGVDSGAELAVREALGATAAGGVTFLWKSNDWGRAVSSVVADWANSDV